MEEVDVGSGVPWASLSASSSRALALRSGSGGRFPDSIPLKLKLEWSGIREKSPLSIIVQVVGFYTSTL